MEDMLPLTAMPPAPEIAKQITLCPGGWLEVFRHETVYRLLLPE
jgi:hypothetical protein